jgi:hypothetical protein
MSLHPHFSDDKFNAMVNVAVGHAQIHPATSPSFAEIIQTWFLNLDKRKAFATIAACAFMLVLSMPMISYTQQTAGDESLYFMSAIVSYDSLSQLGS